MNSEEINLFSRLFTLRNERQKSPIEKRKRNLKKYSPISRRERERDFISQGSRGEREIF